MAKGRVIGYLWEKKGPNEPLDCRVENMAAIARINPNFAALKAELEHKALEIRSGTTINRPANRTERRVRSNGIA